VDILMAEQFLKCVDAFLRRSLIGKERPPRLDVDATV